MTFDKKTPTIGLCTRCTHMDDLKKYFLTSFVLSRCAGCFIQTGMKVFYRHFSSYFPMLISMIDKLIDENLKAAR